MVPLGEGTLIVRADASAEIGTGHVMRCLALAQAWQEAGGTAVFAQHRCPDRLAERLRTECVETQAVSAAPGTAADAASTAALARRLGADWVIVDGYLFGAEYQEALREVGLRVLFVDDYGHAERYAADFVLNQNAYADENLYPERAPHTRLLLGLRYLLLRREFWPWQGLIRTVPERVRRILVTLGGGDPRNVTGVVVEALRLIDDPQLEAVVLVGAASPHVAAVRGQAEGDERIEVRHNVTDMPALMAWADLAVSAGGSTCWELAFLGTPNLACPIAQNQVPITRALAEHGVAVALGWHEEITAEGVQQALQILLTDRERRAAMGERGRRLVDSRGPKRVVAELGPGASSSARATPRSDLERA